MDWPVGRVHRHGSSIGTARFTQEDPIGLAGGMNLYGYADGDPINNHDPFGLTPAIVLPAGVGVYVAGAGLIAAATMLANGEDFEAAWDAGADAMSGAWANVKGKITERQIQGQQKPIEAHFKKLANPNQPGGNDPNNRDKWKKDIQKAIDIQKDKLKKLKEGDRRDRMDQQIKSNEDRLKNVP